MSIKILMPALSPTMKDGILQRWLVKVGDKIKAGDVIAEIETDKASMDVEAVDEGTITSILVKEGTEGILVNSPIAILNGSKENMNDHIAEDFKKENYKIDEKKKKDFLDKEKLSLDDEYNLSNNKKKKLKENLLVDASNYRISPLAKKIAKKKKINLSTITGSGPKGRIIKRDLEIENIHDKKFISSSSYEVIEASSVRKIIAEKTTLTMNEVPHFYLSIESNVDKLLSLRKKINNNLTEKKISINDILVKALALAQNKNPKTNVSWFDGKIIKYSSVDVSIAVAIDEGLVTPIVKNANKKGLCEISNEIKLLIKKAKNGNLSPEEYTGGTISISNLGMYGIAEFSAIINQPQSCILAVGSIQKKYKLEGKDIKIINFIKSTLSADHRVLDGAVAANLLKDFSDIIENPFNLWLESKDMEIM